MKAYAISKRTSLVVDCYEGKTNGVVMWVRTMQRKYSDKIEIKIKNQYERIF